jgi:hypothetical protein
LDQWARDAVFLCTAASALRPRNFKNGIDMIQQNPESANIGESELAQQEKII